MTIEKIYENSSLVLMFKGCLDTESAPLLEAELKAIEQPNSLVFDFKDLEYISSSGLRQVIVAYKMSIKEGFEFKIINANNEVLSVFSITGLTDKLNIS